jgi:hypothetical protein
MGILRLPLSYGNTCHFLHGEDDTRFNRSEATATKKTTKNKSVCKWFFQSGFCVHGDTCKFSHGDTPTAGYPAPPTPPQESPTVGLYELDCIA